MIIYFLFISILGLRLIKNFSSVPEPEMPPCDFYPQKYEGISYEKVDSIRKELINPTLFHYYKKPLFIVQGHMQWLFDDTGKRYLDLFGGIVTVSVGHCHPKVTKTAVEQLGKLWHTTNIYYHPNIHEYAEKLTQRLPGNLKVCFFTNSGSEANDLAMLMSRIYTGNFDVSMNPDPYRGIWGGSFCRDSPIQTDRKCSCSPGECQAADSYANELNDVLMTSVNKKGMAAFFAESIQGVGGTVQFPKGFLKKAYELVRSRGGLCIADEVQTGFGRLGTHYWGFQTHDVMPDIVCMAKGMGNGFPIGGVVTTPEIAKSIANALHFNTYGGNPVSTAVASKVLDVIDEDHLQENCRIVGTHFLHKLSALRNEFEIVGDVRGKGLMIGVEFVTDKQSKTPLPAEDYSMIQEECKKMGILTGNGGGNQRVLIEVECGLLHHWMTDCGGQTSRMFTAAQPVNKIGVLRASNGIVDITGFPIMGKDLLKNTCAAIDFSNVTLKAADGKIVNFLLEDSPRLLLKSTQPINFLNIRYWFIYSLQVMRIKPPMCITRADADFTVDVLRKSIQTYMEKKQ
ncbi:Alanine--glyoxylate aminotransferase 2, mitochondrial [Nymphon striatum]|nr:Alanine--glyoxylate aminotransferase 2, mitochondrial [Nymphon striatum]